MTYNTKVVYSVSEIASILGISKSAAYNFVNSGETKKLFNVKRIGATIKIVKASFDKWLYETSEVSE